MSNKELSIVIPTLNEKDNIVILLARIEKLFVDHLDIIEIIVVDENSPDKTYEHVLEYGRGKNYIRSEKNPLSPGLSQSIIHGFDIAEGKFLCCMDGDLQHDESYLKTLFSEVKQNDLVIGSRYIEGGGFADAWNPVRKAGSQFVTLLTQVMLKVNVKDPMSGFFMIRREAYSAVRSRLNPTGFKIMLELLYNLKQAKLDYSIKEVGIMFRNRVRGKSKMSFKVLIEFIKMLFDLKRRVKPEK